MFNKGRGTSAPDVQVERDLDFKKPVWRPLDVDDEERKARKEGESDGKLGVPSRNDSVAHALEVYKQRGKEVMDAVAQDWRETNRVLHGEWSRLWHVLQEREEHVPSLQAETHRLDAIVSAKQKAYDARRAAVEKLDPSQRHRIGRVAYIAGLAAVFLIDVPLNSVVFNIFHAQPLETLLLAGLLGILIVPAAHVLGIQLRNGIKDRIASGIAASVPLLFIVGIAYIRKEYLKEHHSKYLTGTSGLLVFVVFNLAIFTSAVFLSYLRHDPQEQALEESARELKRTKAERDAAAGRLETAQLQVAAIEARMAEIRAWAEEELAKAKNRAYGERQIYERLMHLYCGANKGARVHTDEPIAVLETFFEGEWQHATVPPDLKQDALPDWTPAVSAPASPIPATT